MILAVVSVGAAGFLGSASAKTTSSEPQPCFIVASVIDLVDKGQKSFDKLGTTETTKKVTDTFSDINKNLDKAEVEILGIKLVEGEEYPDLAAELDAAIAAVSALNADAVTYPNPDADGDIKTQVAEITASTNIIITKANALKALLP